MLIDLRSDTVTKPSKEMLEAMFSAEVGDDVYGEDPTVIALEQKGAEMFGMEEGLFCASGTMTNQIALKVLTRPGDEVICDRHSHIYNFEGGGIAFNSGASVRLLEGDRGRLSPQQISENVNDPNNIHFPVTSLVSLENTVNRAGGSYYTLDQIKEIYKECVKHNLGLHMDGARIFNALEETGEQARDYGNFFNSISVCLSKGLGTPVGSLLLGDKELIVKAKRVRKVFGGGWRQAGYLAAAGIYALNNNITRLKEDHGRARVLADTLNNMLYVTEVLPQETNIVIFRIEEQDKLKKFIPYMAEHKILLSSFGKDSVRMVTHLDFTDDMLERTINALRLFH